jgi:hypothetical protein
VRTSEVETLLISGALDTATPPQAATNELLPHLPNGHQVVLPAHGHISSFFTEQPEAGTRLINTFLASCQVDDSFYQPQTVDFAPVPTLTTLAKMVAGVMFSLALLTLLSLLWMARRVRQRGFLGDRTGATLRSVYLVVVGLGSWFLVGLIVMAAMPAIRLNDEVLVVLSVAAATALGSYFAWVHSNWPAARRTLGFAATTGGALLAAWLGFCAAGALPAPLGGLLAPFTAILAAAVGANLSLLVLDIWTDRQARPHRIDTNVEPTLEVPATPA